MDLQFLFATGCYRCRSPPDAATYSPLCALANSHVATHRARLLHRPVDEPQVLALGKRMRELWQRV